MIQEYLLDNFLKYLISLNYVIVQLLEVNSLFYYFLNAVPLILDKRKAALADPESIWEEEKVIYEVGGKDSRNLLYYSSSEVPQEFFHSQKQQMAHQPNVYEKNLISRLCSRINHDQESHSNSRTSFCFILFYLK